MFIGKHFRNLIDNIFHIVCLVAKHFINWIEEYYMYNNKKYKYRKYLNATKSTQKPLRRGIIVFPRNKYKYLYKRMDAIVWL